MLTIYTWPKSFEDPHIALIQRNAVRSWLLLTPKPAIFVFGEASGVAEYCAEFGLTHLKNSPENPIEVIDGTVRLRDMATRVEEVSKTQCYCFINADIVLTSSLMRALPKIAARFDRFLLGASPWDVNVRETLAFEPGWEQALKQRAVEEDGLRRHFAADFFLYPRGFLARAPEVLIGRWYVDNGVMWFTRKIGAALVDGTSGIFTVHQNHDYKHLGKHAFDPSNTAGAHWNLNAIGGWKHNYSWNYATDHYTPDGIRPYWAGRAMHWLGVNPAGGRGGRFLADKLWTPLMRATGPLRRALGLTNPRHMKSPRV